MGLNPLKFGGIAAVGGGVLVMGLQAVFTGNLQLRSRRGRRRASYSGLFARAFGLVLALVGLGIIGIGSLLLTGLAGPVTAALAQFAQGDFGAGLVSSVIGIGFCIWALGNIIGSNEQKSSAMAVVTRLPGRIFGLLFFLGGVVVIVYGVLRATAPELLNAWHEAVLAAVR